MDLTIDSIASISKTITEQDVHSFAELSGDFNPVHVDKDEAKKSIFKKRIAHGMLVGSLISSVIGMKLPGPGTIYMEQNFTFLKPVYLGDTVTAYVEVDEVINKKKGIYRLKTYVKKQDDSVVIDGYAVVKYQ